MNLPVIAGADDYRRHFGSEVWRQAAVTICARHRLPRASLRRAGQGENIIFLVGRRYVIKIFAPFRGSFLREKAALELAGGKLGVETPSILYAGELEGWSYLVMTQLAGTPASRAWSEIGPGGRVEIVTRLGEALRRLHEHAAPPARPAPLRDWRGFIERQAETCVERQRACGANPEWLESLPAYVAERLELLPKEFEPVLLHGDVHLGNLLLSPEKGRWKLAGMFDFGDSLCGFREYDFVAPGVLMVQGSRELQRAMLLAYGYRESQLDEGLRSRLMLLTVLYECSDLRKYAMRLAPEAVTLRLGELEAAIWTFSTR